MSVALAPNQFIKDMSMSNSAVCAITSSSEESKDNNLICWGFNYHNNLGYDYETLTAYGVSVPDYNDDPSVISNLEYESHLSVDTIKLMRYRIFR